MKVENATVNGFRSSFRDWTGECTSFPREVAEGALAHTIGDETERAYRRGDALEKQRKLMEAWAGFLAASKVAASGWPTSTEPEEPMARRSKIAPYRQGQLDGLCGLYAIINAPAAAPAKRHGRTRRYDRVSRAGWRRLTAPRPQRKLAASSTRPGERSSRQMSALARASG
jgi:hypothetical protein